MVRLSNLAVSLADRIQDILRSNGWSSLRKAPWVTRALFPYVLEFPFFLHVDAGKSIYADAKACHIDLPPKRRGRSSDPIECSPQRNS